MMMGLVFVLLTWFLLALENPVLYPPQKERFSRTMREALLPFEASFNLKISYFILCRILLLLLFLIEWLIQFFWFFFSEQCRQAKISYTGKLTVDVCFQYNDGPVIRETTNFGQFPIMLQVCLLPIKHEMRSFTLYIWFLLCSFLKEIVNLNKYRCVEVSVFVGFVVCLYIKRTVKCVFFLIFFIFYFLFLHLWWLKSRNSSGWMKVGSICM